MSASPQSDGDPNRPSERLEARLEELWSMTHTLRQQLEQRDTEHIISLQHTINLLMEENVALTEDCKALRTQLWMAQKRIVELEEQLGPEDGTGFSIAGSDQWLDEGVVGDIVRQAPSGTPSQTDEAAGEGAEVVPSMDTPAAVLQEVLTLPAPAPAPDSLPNGVVAAPAVIHRPEGGTPNGQPLEQADHPEPPPPRPDGIRAVSGEVVCCEPALERPGQKRVPAAEGQPASARLAWRAANIEGGRSEARRHVLGLLEEELRPEDSLQPWDVGPAPQANGIEREAGPRRADSLRKASPPTAMHAVASIPQTTHTLRQVELRRSVSPATHTERPGAHAARQKVRRSSLGGQPQLQQYEAWRAGSPRLALQRPQGHQKAIAVSFTAEQVETLHSAKPRILPGEGTSPRRVARVARAANAVPIAESESQAPPGEARSYSAANTPFSRLPQSTQPYRHSSTTLRPKPSPSRHPRGPPTLPSGIHELTAGPSKARSSSTPSVPRSHGSTAPTSGQRHTHRAPPQAGEPHCIPVATPLQLEDRTPPPGDGAHPPDGRTPSPNLGGWHSGVQQLLDRLQHTPGPQPGRTGLSPNRSGFLAQGTKAAAMMLSQPLVTPVPASHGHSPSQGPFATLDHIQRALADLLPGPSPTQRSAPDPPTAGVRHFWGPGYARRLSGHSTSPTEHRLKQDLLQRAYDPKSRVTRQRRSASFPLSSTHTSKPH